MLCKLFYWFLCGFHGALVFACVLLCFSLFLLLLTLYLEPIPILQMVLEGMCLLLCYGRPLAVSFLLSALFFDVRLLSFFSRFRADINFGDGKDLDSPIPLDSAGETEPPMEELVSETAETPSVEAIVRGMSSNSTLYSNNKETTAKLKAMSKNTADYQKSRNACELRFFDILSCSPNFSFMAELQANPLDPKKTTRRLYILCGGVVTNAKVKLLNFALVYYHENFVKKKFADVDMENASPNTKAMAQYQPGSIATLSRRLFATFKANGVYISLSQIKALPGSFFATTQTKMAVTSSVRSDYGRVNRARFDEDEEEKVRLVEDYHHVRVLEFDRLLRLTIWRVMKDFMLRGKNEVRLSECFTI